MTNKRTCEYCGWHGDADELLRARNPFDEVDELQGCPSCKSINTTVVACDEPDCWKPVVAGTPTPTGYRKTCGQHVPRGTFMALAALLLCFIASCTGPARILSTHDVPSHVSPLASPPTSCVAIDADKLDDPAPLEALFIWGHRSKFWPADACLKVRFLDGSAFQQDRAWARFRQIDEVAGIAFCRVESGPSDIRVSFRPGSGHWSYLGNSCSQIPQTAATMNLGLSTSDSPEEWRRVADHEILHALGFSHEAQSPRASIPWNRPAVYAWYSRTQGWSNEQTDRQVLNREGDNDFAGTDYDPKSIMHYPCPPELLTDRRAAVGWNSRLSESDLAFLKKTYP